MRPQKIFIFSMLILFAISCSPRLYYKNYKNKKRRERIVRRRKAYNRRRRNAKRYFNADIVKINIDQNVVLPFCKSEIEIWFKNKSSKEDTTEGRFRFITNKNSFIKSMQLEINGVWERDITFTNQTGKKIYNELTGQNEFSLMSPIDPALLEKVNKDEYFLRVFPVTHSDIRKVKLEMYSLLESNDSLDLEWKFYNKDSRWPILDQDLFELNLRHTKPKNYSVTLNRHRNPEKLNKFSCYSEEISKGIWISYDIPDKLSNQKIGKFYLYDTDKNSIPEITVIRSQETIEVIDKILDNKTSTILVEDSSFQNDIFLMNFVNYLNQTKNYNIFFGKDWWNHSLENFMIDENYILSYNKQISDDTITDYQCDFTEEFAEYFKNYHTSIDTQVVKGLLTEETIKLVPEYSDEAKKIIRKNLSIEKQGNTDTPRVNFIPYDCAPQPIGGFNAIQRRLIYPEKALKKKLEGTVILRVYVHSNGIPDKITILKSPHPRLDKAAIKAVKQTTFQPARQRDRRVGVWFCIPVVFNIEKYKKYEVPFQSKEFKNLKKNFTFDIKDNKIFATDKNFNSDDFEIYKYKTAELYELMIKNPKLIKLIYKLYLLDVGTAELELKGKSYYIEMNYE